MIHISLVQLYVLSWSVSPFDDGGQKSILVHGFREFCRCSSLVLYCIVLYCVAARRTSTIQDYRKAIFPLGVTSIAWESYDRVKPFNIANM